MRKQQGRSQQGGGGRGRGKPQDRREGPARGDRPSSSSSKPGKFSPGPWDPGVRAKARGGAPQQKRQGPPSQQRGPSRREQPELQSRAPRSATTESLVYGMRSVAALLRADPRRVAKLYIEEGRSRSGEAKELLEDAEDAGLHVQRVSTEELAALTHGAVHQGVVAQVAPFEFSSVDEILRVGDTPLLLVLDEVTDPQNVGAAARAAWALGGTGLLLPKDRTATITAAAEKVASGALAQLKVAEVTNLARTLEDLKKRGVWIIGLDVDGDAPLHKQDLTMPVALVVGSEHSGMRRLTREMCDAVLTIPMAHDEAALNAADAAAIAFYEAARQRLSAGDDEEDDAEEE